MVSILSGGRLLYYRMVSRPTSNTAISPQSVFPFLLAWALVIVFAVIAVKELRPPSPLPANAPENEFSSQRAIVHVREIARVPHPLGTGANTTVRKYLLSELSAFGVQTSVFSDLGINASGPIVVAGRVNDIVGRLPGASPGSAILLMAHYDSVPRAPGAGDDGSGVATILEIVRALHAAPRLQRDVIILLTEGEEDGLLGAEASADSHPWMSNVGLILNFETRGNHGPSLLFDSREWAFARCARPWRGRVSERGRRGCPRCRQSRSGPTCSRARARSSGPARRLRPRWRRRSW